MNDILTVSALNNYIKAVIGNDPNLRLVKLKGELFDVKKYPSGHIYFSVKDPKSTISAVMFASDTYSLSFAPKDGDEVLLIGSVNVYETKGKYSLYVRDMQLYGKGAELLALEELKKKLAAEGLFDPSKKREINRFPNSIGIICAKDSAAASDLITNIHRRLPTVTIYTFYSAVQGKEAPKELLEAVKLANEYPLDTLIIGRGGGSNDDLSAFNDETLVRELAKSKAPTISAVGHEIDFTLVDFVADKRASTPTGAAELATTDKDEIFEKLDDARSTMFEELNQRLIDIKDHLEMIKNRPFFINPSSMYKDELIELESLKERLNKAISHSLFEKKSLLSSKIERLKGLSPYGVIKRGYAIVRDEKGNVIKDAKDIKVNDNITTTLRDGIIKSTVVGKGE